MEIKIQATTGRAQGEAVQVRATKFFIGRHDNCQLKPDIPELAGIHALIEQRDGGLHLRDFGAEGGTGINDRVLHARETEVFSGDLIQIGPMVLTLWTGPKGEGPRAHHSVPDGWPFFAGTAGAEPPRPRRVEEPTTTPVATPERRPEPEPARPVAQPKPAAATATVEPPASPVIRTPPAATPRPAPLPLPPSSRPSLYRSIACETIGGVLVVKILAPELNEEASVSPVRYELRNLLDGEAPNRMVIDLGNTRYLSSRAVGVILAHYQALERQGGVLRVCGVSREIKPVLDQMRLSMLIDVYPTVAEAVEDSWE